MSSYLHHAPTPRETPQSEPIPGTSQVQNDAGGFVFSLGPMDRLRRWLILGNEGGTYYAGQRRLTVENIAALRAALEEDGLATVDEIVRVSGEGRAARPDQAIYALAVACAHENVDVRRRAIAAIPRVCRTGTHLFMFVGFVEKQRGWGRALRRGVAEWFNGKDPERLSYQLVKYRQRDGWTPADVLRLSHPKPLTGEHDVLFGWATGHAKETPAAASIVAYEEAQRAEAPGDTASLVRRFGGALPREALNTDHLKSAAVWAALLSEGMPMTALVRNLPTLTRVGVLAPMSEGLATALAQLGDAERLRRARIHPLQVLMALVTYRAGQSYRGSTRWEPLAQIVDALDAAFYESFQNVTRTGKRHLLAVDISSSMSQELSGSFLSCRAAAAAMALTVARVEPAHHFVGFSGVGLGAWTMGRRRFGALDGVCPLPISPRQRLDDVVRATSNLPFGSTDCALPMLYALQREMPVDCFVVLTDNETWAGEVHPVQALARYREKMNIAAKLAVIAFTSTAFSIADPNDRGMLDCVGFDSGTPAILADFVGEEVGSRRDS